MTQEYNYFDTKHSDEFHTWYLYDFKHAVPARICKRNALHIMRKILNGNASIEGWNANNDDNAYVCMCQRKK